MNTVLVIDDEPSVASTIAKVLTRAGFRVTVAGDGKAGLASFNAERPGLVITDLFMPEKEGIEIIRELRKLASDVPIIAISGGIRSGDYLRMARKLGATQVLGKPFSHDELLSIVSHCFERGTSAPSSGEDVEQA